MHSGAVIVGAGVMGTSIALDLARSGRSVTVIDKARGRGHGSTSASSAVRRFNFSTLARYISTGLAFLDVDIAPRAGHVGDPQLAAADLADTAVRRGAVFLLGRAVTQVVRKSGRVAAVLLDDGTRIDTGIVVNEAGPWSGRINELAGVGDDFTISLRTVRQEVHHVPAPAGRGAGEATISVCTSAPKWAGACSSAAPSRNAIPSSGSTTLTASPPTTGRPSTTGRTCPATTWRSEPAATSSRTPPRRRIPAHDHRPDRERRGPRPVSRRVQGPVHRPHHRVERLLPTAAEERQVLGHGFGLTSVEERTHRLYVLYVARRE